MNSQWKLVPVEPTETMVINGFESVPDVCFTDEEVWEQYQEMSGCQQAAFRAKLCWAAMLAASPAPATAGAPEIVAYHVVDEFGQKKVLLPGAEGIKRHRARGATLRGLTDIDQVGRLVAERDALQQLLNAADQRIDELTSKPGPDTSVCRGSTALGTACGKCARCLAPPGEVKFKGMIETACGTFAIMIDEANVHCGWTFQRHPDGMWVSGRKATEAEMNAARAHAKVLALFQPS